MTASLTNDVRKLTITSLYYIAIIRYLVVGYISEAILLTPPLLAIRLISPDVICYPPVFSANLDICLLASAFLPYPIFLFGVFPAIEI